jgi:hypothetical protein
VTFSIRVEDSRSSGKEIVSPRTTQVPNNLAAKRSEAHNPSAIVPNFLFLEAVLGAAPRGAFVDRHHRLFPTADSSIGVVVPW